MIDIRLILISFFPVRNASGVNDRILFPHKEPEGILGDVLPD